MIDEREKEILHYEFSHYSIQMRKWMGFRKEELSDKRLMSTVRSEIAGVRSSKSWLM